MPNRSTPNFRNTHAVSGHSQDHPLHGNGDHHFNPAANQFRPFNQNGDISQVSPPFHHLNGRVQDLEHEMVALREEVGLLHSSVDTLKKGGWDVQVGPFKDQTAAHFKQQLDQLSAEARGARDGADDDEEARKSMPSHLRAASVVSGTSSSVPPYMKGKNSAGREDASGSPHLQTGATIGSSVKSFDSETVTSPNNPLVTDGNVDSKVYDLKSPGAEPTPPLSPRPTTHPHEQLSAIKDLTLNPTGKPYQPSFIANLPPLSPAIIAQIPVMHKMATFSPDFLRNTFGGYEHSPGLMFIPPSPGPCILRSRSYYTVDAAYDPYLPSAPGLHGAKLVPFFNTDPEDEFDMRDSPSSTVNVPLFVLLDVTNGSGKKAKRYIYFGHYSQTRWSDRLDADRMQTCVPPVVRAFWAEELSASGRAAWVTAALQNHFFAKPVYEGKLPGTVIDEGGSVASDDVDKRAEKVRKDVGKFVGELGAWEKEARMRTSLIKKDFVLQAFDRADADDPPALRLWWEYLECVDWKADFYNMIATLQGREKGYERF